MRRSPARRQLERWEPLVAAFLLAKCAGQASDDPTLWAAEAEHTFAPLPSRERAQRAVSGPQRPARAVGQRRRRDGQQAKV